MGNGRFRESFDRLVQAVHISSEPRAQFEQRVPDRFRPMSDSFDPTATETSAILREGLHLVVFGGDGAKGYRVPPGGSLTIGRSTECDVRVDTPSMSRKHFTVRDASPPQIEDLGGRNGTRVNGHAIETGAAVAFELGSLIEAGGAFFTMQDHPPREFAKLPSRADTPPTPVSGPAGTVVRDPAMVRLHELIDQVARSDIPVLVLGETGVGKEVISAAIHHASVRAARPYVILNCAALPEALLESELFGYEKGAFTGASQSKRGLIEAAHEGSMLLDEVGEMPLSTQAKLLRVLENGELMRLGAVRPQRVNVRFIAATNRDLSAMVAKGIFRRDLYYRLNGITIPIPPLRQRKAEIPELARFFVERAAANARRATPALPQAVLDVLDRHSWPGNIRELKNVLERAVVLCRGSTLAPEQVIIDAEPQPAEIVASPAAAAPTAEVAPNREGRLLRLDADTERRLIVEALERAAGNQTKASELLGISRRTLINRLDEYGLQRPRKR
jgi:transcriptional regulator with GAF, ATPase, and Fis domain